MHIYVFIYLCSLAKYLYTGFVTLQTAVNAAIIEVRNVLINTVSSFQKHQDFEER